MTARPNRAVRTLASIVLIPKIALDLPKAAIQSVKDFNEDVREEVDFRKKLATEYARNKA
jgi:hypothetical protein